MLKNVLLIICVVTLSTSTGCVSKSSFELMEGEASRLETELNSLQERYNNQRNEKDELRKEKEALELDYSELQADNKQLSLILAAKSDSFSEIISDLRKDMAEQRTECELQIDSLGKDNLELQNQLEQLSEEKKQQVEEMSSTYEELLNKMKSEIDKGQVTISELKGKLTVNMVDAILFDSGKAEVKADGLVILQKVVDILQNVTDKAIRIEGHTDNVQIIGALAKKYPTNWELSAARAVNVTRFLQEQGLNPENLGVVAYSEYKPIADNETEEGKARNRRIEIILVAKE